MAIDQTGDVWVGTADGLARIRGEQIDVFTTDTVSVFPNNAIRSIASRGDGTLWLTFSKTNTIVQCNPLETPTWTTLSGTNELPKIKNHLFVDSEETVWLTGLQGEAFQFSDGRWQKLSKQLHFVSQATNGLLCGVFGNDIHYRRDGQWKTESLPEGEYATCMTPGIDDGMLIGTQRSLFHWTPGQLSEIRVSEAQHCRSVLFQRESELIYLGTRYGVQRATRPVWRRYTENAEGAALLPETLCFDSQLRPICVGDDASVTVFEQEKWKTLFTVKDPNFDPQKRCVTADSLWALYPEYIFEISLQTGEILRKQECPSKAIRSATDPAILFPTSSGKIWCVYEDGIYSNLVSRIFEDSSGTIWVVYRENGVGSYRDGLWLNYGTESGLPRWIIDHIGEDSSGRLWVSKQAPRWDLENVHEVFRYNPDRERPDTEITAYPREGVSSHGIGVFSFTGRDAWGQTPKSKLVYS